MKKEQMIFAVIIGILVFYIGNRCGYIYCTSTAADMVGKLNDISEGLEEYSLAFTPKSLLAALCSMFFYALGVIYVVFAQKNRMPGIDHGSAKWGTSADIAKYKDKKPDNDMILTATESMSLNTRQTMRNNNILVIGGSGSGKTRFFVKPNLMQLHCSYVMTDPKGTVMAEVGNIFAEADYEIKTFNTVDFSKSMHYNPFTFIKSESDIKVFADMIITSTKQKGEKSNDPFWENAECLLYMALIGYMFYELNEDEQNFETLIKILNKMEVKEEDEDFKNHVDYMFEELEIGTDALAEKYGIEFPPDRPKKQPQPDHFAVSQYCKFKMAAGKTLRSILITAGVRLSPFDVKEVREMTRYDEMELGTMGDKKTMLFIIIDDKVSTYNFLANMMYCQLFKELCDKADTVYGGRLPVHVRFLIDEFANVGMIPSFEKIISVIRSREISVSVIVQNLAQIESLYDKQMGTIVGNCDTTLFLGSGEVNTMKNISERVGKSTIDHTGSSTTKGTQGSYSLQDQILGRELITPDEVGRLDNNECILFIRGLRPFKSRKYDITKHKNFRKTADFNKKYLFDILEYNKSKKIQEEKEDREFDLDEYLLDDMSIEELDAKGIT